MRRVRSTSWRFGLLVLAAFAWVGTSGTIAFAQDAEQQLEQDRKEAQAEIQKDSDEFPVVEAQSVRDVFNLTVESGRLVFKYRLDQQVNDHVVLRTKDLKGFTRLLVMNLNGNPLDSPDVIFMLENYDFARKGISTTSTTLMQTPQNLQICETSESPRSYSQITLIQTPPGSEEAGVSFEAKVDDDSGNTLVDIHAKAKNFSEFRKAYPRETSVYILPMLRTLRQEAIIGSCDPFEAWQVLGDGVPADPKIATQVEAIIPKLNADEFNARRNASEELAKLGQDAALYLMVHPPKNLSPEQKVRLDAFMAPYTPMTAEEVRAARENREFLLGCLFSDSEAIRKLALARLNKLSDKPIEFDVNADPDVRFEAILKLRPQVLPEEATTQPEKP